MSGLLIQNETDYDGRSVKAIVRWVLRELDLTGDMTVVKVKHHNGSHAYQGRFYANAHAHHAVVYDYYGGWKEIAPVIPFTYRSLIVCRIGRPEVYPVSTHVYRRKDSPGVWTVADWKEALVSITAHEAMHLRQYLTKPKKRGRYNEVETEWAAFRLWKRWKAERTPKSPPA